MIGFVRSLILGSAAALLALSAPALLRADPAQDQYAVAAGHYVKRRWQFAAEEFQVFLREHPNHPKAASARFFAAEALLQLRRYGDARDEYRRFVNQFSDDAHATQALFRLGESAYLAGDYADSRSSLEEFLDKHPDDALNAYTLEYLGEIALVEEKPQRAREYFQKALDRFPRSALSEDCRLGIARALDKLGSRQEAIAAFHELAQGDSKLADAALFHLAACYYADKKYDDALATLDQFDDRHPQSGLRARAHLLRAWSMFQLGRLEEAATTLKPLAGDKQVSAEAQYWLALIHKKLNQWDAAVATLQAAVALHDDSPLLPAMQFHLGDALLYAGKAPEADSQFALVLSANPESEWADDCLLGRARAALATGDLAAVEQFGRDYRSRWPQGSLSAEFQRIAAQAQLAAGQETRAIETLTPLAQSGTAQDQYLLADALQRAGKYEDSLQALASIPDADKAQVGAILDVTRGMALMGLKRFGEAIGCFDRYLAEDPHGASAALALAEKAICLMWQDRTDEAKSLFDQLQLMHGDQPIYLPATARLADVALAQGKLEIATALYDELAAANSDEMAARGLFGLGRAAYRQEKWDQAAEKLEALCDRFPGSTLAGEAALMRGAALERLDDCDAAQHLYAVVLEKHSDGPIAERAKLAAARLHRRCHQTKEAIGLYQNLLDGKPSVISPDVVYYELAWLLRDAGRIAEADELFARIHEQHGDSVYWPDATYRLAEDARARREYEAADRFAGSLLERATAKHLHEYALYLRGQMAIEQQQWAAAAETMQKLIETFPQSKLNGQSRFWLAEALYRQNKIAEAERRFESLAESNAAHGETWEAVVVLRRAQILAQRKEWATARQLAESIAPRFRDFKQQYEVDYLLGRALANEANFDGARDAYRRVTRSTEGGKTETAAMAQWMIGESYFHQKNYRAAIKEYLRVEILYAFPTWQSAALLQAGKCHELLGEHAQAAELYRRLLKDYPDSQFAEEASRRLDLAGAKPATRRS